MVVLPILWTVLLAFQRLRLLNLRSAGLFGEFTLDNFDNVFASPSFWGALGTTLAYSVLGTAARDRPRAGRGARAAQAVPRPRPRPGGDAAALRRPDRGRDVRLEDDAQPAVRRRELLGHPAAGLGRADRVPEPAQQRGLGVRADVRRPDRAAHGDRLRGVALVPVRVPVPHRAAAGRAGHAGGGRAGGRRHRVTQRFRYVLLPQLLPTIAVLAVLRFIWTFNSFDDIYLLTGGGAGTEVVSVSVFNALTARGDIGGAAAQALVLAAILAVLVGLYLWRLAPREEQS